MSMKADMFLDCVAVLSAIPQQCCCYPDDVFRIRRSFTPYLMMALDWQLEVVGDFLEAVGNICTVLDARQSPLAK
jgi:hypothetical protein